MKKDMQKFIAAFLVVSFVVITGCDKKSTPSMKNQNGTMEQNMDNQQRMKNNNNGNHGC